MCLFLRGCVPPRNSTCPSMAGCHHPQACVSCPEVPAFPLVSGHLLQGDADSTFCSACTLRCSDYFCSVGLSLKPVLKSGASCPGPGTVGLTLVSAGRRGSGAAALLLTVALSLVIVTALPRHRVTRSPLRGNAGNDLSYCFMK